MQWTGPAEKALSRVPLFVRGRVRKRVEEEAERRGAREVRLEHVEGCRKRFLENMEDEVQGYRIETCLGGSGCSNSVVPEGDVAGVLEALFSRIDMKGLLQDRVGGPLKMHHEFRVSLSNCPNACSRPQIVDIGLIGGCRPRVAADACNGCGACVEICREGAITMTGQPAVAITIDPDTCLACGQCIGICPTAGLLEGARGYRILLGGKLGRHPQLGKELPSFCSMDELVHVVQRCLIHYQKHNRHGERFGEILNRTGLTFLDDGGEDPHRCSFLEDVFLMDRGAENVSG
jgi:anaerobic sulfite reductase subunit C